MSTCPRCQASMVQRTATPAQATAPITADVCDQCGGLWLDGAELGHVSPALGGLPMRLAEIAGVAVESPIACPRCRGVMMLFDLLDVAVDLCTQCQGVWLDGGEYEALGRAEGSTEAPQQTARKSPGTVSCKACGRKMPLSGSYYT